MTKTQNESTAVAAPVDEKLIAKLDEGFPPSWQPEQEGDAISGAFLRLEQGMTTFGPSPIVILGTPEGERSVWLFAESIKNAFLRAQPVPGELVAIRFEGEQAVKNPTPGRKATAKVFRVVVDRPAQTTAAVDWTAALGSPSASSDDDAGAGDDGIPY
jgi:hypothetical protein